MPSLGPEARAREGTARPGALTDQAARTRKGVMHAGAGPCLPPDPRAREGMWPTMARRWIVMPRAAPAWGMAGWQA